MELHKMIPMSAQRSVLLFGKKGLNMKEDALAFARVALHIENPELHPDFLFISTEGRNLVLEDIVPIMSKASNPPVIADYIVIIIDEMEKMTIQCQNKLLLLLESNPYSIVIGICYADTLLSTIKSRMNIIPYSAFSEADFLKSCGLPYEDAHLFYTVSEGVLSKADFFNENRDMFKKIALISNKCSEREELFEVLGLIKEKDKASVTNNAELMGAVLRIMASCFMRKAITIMRTDRVRALDALSVSERCSNEVLLVDKPTYTKNDFFLTVTFAVEGRVI